MPRKFVKFLECDNVYACRDCGSHLSSLSQLISEAFQGQTGQAFLFNNVINIKQGKSESKNLRTGLHKTADIYCNICDTGKAIGWKYISASQSSQKYKEGKFILEKAYLQKQSWIDLKQVD